jgi:pimeloyl-ACP methyl ester carboxylesterase
MPSLIIWNRHDPYYTVKGAVKAKKLMPQAQLEIMPGYGHAPHRTERETFNRLLLAFLGKP